MGVEQYNDRVVTPREEALKKIKEELTIGKRQPEEFTVNEVADQLEVQYKTAEYRLNKLEREGKVSSRKVGRYRYYKWVD